MYLLDTNILSELMKKQPNPHFLKKLRSQSPQSLKGDVGSKAT